MVGQANNADMELIKREEQERTRKKERERWTREGRGTITSSLVQWETRHLAGDGCRSLVGCVDEGHNTPPLRRYFAGEEEDIAGVGDV
jgi:hypothetical protein